MDKSRILLIGTGRCGNKIVDEMLETDGRYTGLFINTTDVDLSDLENAKQRNTFIVPNASGTGKNRNTAKQYVQEEDQKILDRISKYTQQDTIICIASADGGSGSGITPLLINLINAIIEGKTINLVAVLPRYNEGKRALENTIAFWNEVMKLYSRGIIKSIMLVDNNKRDTDTEINEKLIEDLDACLGAEGLTDETDSWVVNNDRGYKIVLNLEEGYDTVEEAIDACIAESVFIYPEEAFKNCNSILGLLNPEAYDIESAKNQYSAKNFKKYGESEDYNTLILGGCRIPREAIDVYVEQLEEIRNEEKNSILKEEDLIVDVSPTVSVNINDFVSKKVGSKKIKKKSLKEKLNDKSLWEI